MSWQPPTCGAWSFVGGNRRCEWPATIWIADVPLCVRHYDEARLARVRHTSADCFIYFARIGDYVKIGRSRNVKARVATLHMDKGILRPDDLPRGALTLLYAVPAWAGHESLVHVTFADERVIGEWFTASERLLAYVESLRTSGDLTLSGSVVHDLEPVAS